MKRRTFIQTIGAAALATPFTLSQWGSQRAPANPYPSARRVKAPAPLTFGPDQAAVLSVLREHSAAVYLFGGGVVGRLTQARSAYLNFLVESKAFGKLKTGLFRAGVAPVSTPTLPAVVARFTHGDTAYSVLNVELEAFLHQNALGLTVGLIPFAHNFVVYSVDEQWVIDPYGALAGKAARAERYQLKLLQQPKTPLAGFEYCLAGWLDCALLGLEPSAEFGQMEDRVLGSRLADLAQARKVTELVLNYFPDVIELCGPEQARKYLQSPFCLAAAESAAGIDLRRVGAILHGMSKRGEQVTGTQFFRTLDFEFRRVNKVKDPGLGLVDYMVAHGCPIRRTESLMDGVEAALRG